MKRFIGMIILVFWGSSALMSQQYHYYYQGDQVPLELNTEYAYLRMDGIETPAELESLIGDAEVTRFGPYVPSNTLEEVPNMVREKEGETWAEIRFPNPLGERAYFSRLKRIAENNDVTRTAPYFSKGFDDKIGLSDLFVVKLQKLGDPNALYEFANKNNVVVTGRNRFMADWYTLAITDKSKGSALDMANLFFESGQFAAAEPDLMVDEIHCVNDQFWGNQWALENTGQWGGTVTPDVNACDGWSNWTTGDAGTIVAVLDHGFERDHPDLINNNFGNGFDSESGTTPALVLGNHGTACAGIVAAEQDNTIGVSGIAPDCSIMSISNSLLGNPNSRQKRADGINWAWQNGADVISNSWGSGVQYTVIDDAIVNAQTNGRGGLGTVICFSAGNSNASTVGYPANANDDIIAVGAMSPCGERKNFSSCDGESWGSNYGTDLDVMAPGVKVPTTDRQGAAGYNNPSDYHQTFNGTSAACPHVAGLAGLIISMNPCLSQRQVADIIEKTAQKVGSYTYSTTAGRDNGTWNNEMGYGLIDIDAAMQMTRELYIQNVTITGTETFQVHGEIFAGSNVDPTQTAGPVNINSGADVDFKATDGITLDAGFNVNLGAIFDATIISTNCSAWDENAREAAPVVQVEEEHHPVVEDVATPEILMHELAIVPNPFDNELTFYYTLNQMSRVEATMYNLQGQSVKQIIPSVTKLKGHHSQTISLNENVPAGIYFVRLQVNDQIFTRKLIKQ